jgi:hypothetical protein
VLPLVNEMECACLMVDPTPMKPHDYRDRAEACEGLAGTAGREETRETMEYLALRWRIMAVEAEVEAKAKKSRPPATQLFFRD